MIGLGKTEDTSELIGQNAFVWAIVLVFSMTIVFLNWVNW